MPLSGLLTTGGATSAAGEGTGAWRGAREGEERVSRVSTSTSIRRGRERGASMSWVGGTEEGGRWEMAGRGVVVEDVVETVEWEGRGRDDRRVRLVRESWEDLRVSGVGVGDCRLMVGWLGGGVVWWGGWGKREVVMVTVTDGGDGQMVVNVVVMKVMVMPFTWEGGIRRGRGGWREGWWRASRGWHGKRWDDGRRLQRWRGRGR